ncbi:helix-turn-helix transcriptional regulator [Caballeronia sp. LZ001]|uniref:helix-turn-helix transcriptional regulator n=1 Tax=Caballeronia sp. LZ001 TaxID=3038553 RepID=UPI00285D4110|nr:helix-turn-helix transcriptional regulator [Caballeronia sp. LZ001]MDR5802156.1 helix-turn-helix transcriptional regulator [Caballeronia sp. LZ001]
MSVSVKNEPDGNDRNSVAETQAFLSQRKIDNLYNSEMSKNDPLGTLLKDARWKRHLTQQQLADAMDLTRANISAWENGLHRPNIKQLFRLSKLLNIDWHMLMSNAHGDAPPGFDWDTPEPDEQPEVLSSPPRSPKPKSRHER